MSSISSVTTNTDLYQVGAQPNTKQIKSDFKALAEALKSGNLTDAQQALATLKTDAPNLFKTDSNQASSQSDPLTALASALQSGDIKSAQAAFSTIQQKVGGHHHHHHSSSKSSTAATDTPPVADPNSTTGLQINTSA